MVSDFHGALVLAGLPAAAVATKGSSFRLHGSQWPTVYATRREDFLLAPFCASMFWHVSITTSNVINSLFPLWNMVGW